MAGFGLSGPAGGMPQTPMSAQQMVATPPQGLVQQPPPQAVDPRSAMLAQALGSMRNQQQGSMGGVGANLMANALLQHAYQGQQNSAINSQNQTVNGLPAQIAAAGYQPPQGLMGLGLAAQGGG